MEEKMCAFDGCESTKIHGLGYCNKHYKRFIKHGYISRTIYDPNVIIVKDDYAEMLLYDINGNEIARTLISLGKVDIVKQYKWCLDSHGYVSCSNKGNKLYLHRFVYGEDAKYIDHILGDKLDNRDESLRECTQSQNIINISKPFSHNTTSGVKGVIFDKERNKWRAEIQIRGDKIHIGRFDTLEEAKNARRSIEEKNFHEFSPVYTD